jgi:hypothetical protein
MSLSLLNVLSNISSGDIINIIKDIRGADYAIHTRER